MTDTLPTINNNNNGTTNSIIGCKRKSSSISSKNSTPSQSGFMITSFSMFVKKDDSSNNNKNNTIQKKEQQLNDDYQNEKRIKLDDVAVIDHHQDELSNFNNDEQKVPDNKFEKIKETTPIKSIIESKNNNNNNNNNDIKKEIIQKKNFKEWDWKSASKKESQHINFLESSVIIKKKAIGTKKVKVQDGLEQTVIDAGQKNVGQIVCNKCKMLYAHGTKEDEQVHKAFCKNIQSQKVFIKNWSNFKVINRFSNDDVIIMVSIDQDTSISSKLKAIKNMVDLDLGYYNNNNGNESKKKQEQVEEQDEKIFLYLDCNSKVLGVLICDRYVEKGYRIESASPVIQCTNTPTSVRCGVSRIWCLPSKRKNGIATKLMESMRTNAFYGYQLKMNEIAVTQPTSSGLSFFSKFFNTSNFLLYKINSN
ncbi:hypothetical protein CYY_006725 [Polysphondylium violaceum]|uniref:N-acetyltransferase domain-containing protein n=1 Tax=Polysphondylium violaceum TaxID=133409 RepID=A0A8J4PPQ1_9MYCE|nr:hypothetical protein CYY_006725 [Polysphondylium violaceum]